MDDSLGRFVELIDGYQPDLIWLDFDTGYVPKEDLRRFAAFYFNRAAQWKKGVAINDKHEDGVFPKCIVLDFERGKTSELKPDLWQTDTSVSWRDWSYIRDDSFKPVDLLIHELIDIVSKNGVLLLDVGPKPDGTIPEEPQRILRAIGEWLKVNGEAIYSTRPCLALGFGEGAANSGGGGFSDRAVDYTAQDYRFTQKDNVIYAIAMSWPENEDHFLIRSFNNHTTLASGGISGVKMLGVKEPIDWKLTSEGLWIRKPATKPCDTAYAFQITTSGIIVEQFDATRVDDEQVQVAVRVRNLDKKPLSEEITFYRQRQSHRQGVICAGQVRKPDSLDHVRDSTQNTERDYLRGCRGQPAVRQAVRAVQSPGQHRQLGLRRQVHAVRLGLGKLDKLTLSMWTQTDACGELDRALKHIRMERRWNARSVSAERAVAGIAQVFRRRRNRRPFRRAPGHGQGLESGHCYI